MTPALDLRAPREPGPGFTKFQFGKRLLYLRGALAPYAAELDARLLELGGKTGRGAGNKGGGFALDVGPGTTLFARIARRGGMMRLVLGDLYLGVHPRPIRELVLTEEARRRGVAVAEAMGAMVEWVGPWVYRGVVLTRALAGMTLWDFVRTDDDLTVRLFVLEQARRAIEKMHREGVFHADLNLHNVFVTCSGENFSVVILDLDRARLYRPPLAPGMRRRNGARLLRSVRKLDPAGRYFDARALALLDVG